MVNVFSKRIADRIRLVSLFILFSYSFVRAQSAMDSLRAELKAAVSDSVRCEILYNMIEAESNDTIWMRYNSLMKNIAVRNLKHPSSKRTEFLFSKYLAESINNQGFFESSKGNLSVALEYYQAALNIRKKINDKKGIVTSHYFVAQVYYLINEYDKALPIYRGIISTTQKDVDPRITSYAYNDMAIIYEIRKDYDSLNICLKNALKLIEELGDSRGMAVILINIGNNLRTQGRYKEAIEFLNRSYTVSIENNIVRTKADYYVSISKIYLLLGELDSTKRYADLGMKLSLQNNYVELIRNAAEVLSEVYEKQHDGGKALSMFKLFIQMKDSITKMEARKVIYQKELEYAYEKKAVADSLKAVEEKKIIAVELKQEKMQRYPLYGGLLLVIVFSVVMVKRYRVTHKQKRIIEIKSRETEIQKLLVEEKQKEIMDSISYAKRLQEAILPPLELVDNFLADNFILYKPKDIVAGDFYWAEKVGDLFFIAAADSTGHGVPGAMVSVVCSNALNRSLKEFNLTDPGKILDKTRELVLETFEKSNREVNDGMDISLLCINKNQKKIYWSGANNRIWFIHNNKLNEIKADKQSVGKTYNPKPFQTHEIEYKEDTTFYLFTDGFADQFGGEKGKKYRYKKMAELFLNTHKNLMAFQKEQINIAFEQWKGNLDQVDDICVIGLKI